MKTTIITLILFLPTLVFASFGQPVGPDAGIFNFANISTTPPPTYIYLDSTNSFSYPTGNSPWTFTDAQGTVNNGYALLFISAKNNTSSTFTVSAVTYDGITLNYITNYAGFDGTATHTAIYVYGAPIGNDASGTKVIGATVSTSPSTHFSSAAVVSVWNNVSQVTTPSSKVSSRVFTSSSTVTMTTVNGGEMASAVVFETSGAVSSIAGGFPLTSSLRAQATNTTATSTSLIYNFSPSDDYGYVGVVLPQ